MFTDKEIAEIVRQIIAIAAPERVILFGSYAKGIATIRSDLDLLVIMKSNLYRHSKELFRPILDKYVISIDIHIYTIDEIDALQHEPYSFLGLVMGTGKTLY